MTQAAVPPLPLALIGVNPSPPGQPHEQTPVDNPYPEVEIKAQLKPRGSVTKDITIVNIYAPNRGAPQYITQTLTDRKGEIDNNTIIAGDFNTPLTPLDSSSNQKINKETQVLNDTLDRWISLISSGNSIQMQKNITSSQVHM